MVDLAGPVSTAAKRAEVEAAVLPRAGRQTAAALRACVRRAVTRIDAAAAADRLVTPCGTGRCGSTPARTACPR